MPCQIYIINQLAVLYSKHFTRLALFFFFMSCFWNKAQAAFSSIIYGLFFVQMYISSLDLE